MGKRKGKGNNAKNEKKKQEKVIADRTFGLKNKNKSKRVQKYVKQVRDQVERKGTKEFKIREREREESRRAKAEKQAHADLLGTLQRATENSNKAARGRKDEDPSTIICDFFRRGMCRKGTKCRFSHDLTEDRKEAKLDVYSDRREEEGAEETTDLTEEELAEMIAQRHGERNKRVQSKIICRHFLRAVEERKYGWFWSCPNGGNDCQYRHALPPDFVLRSQAGEVAEEAEELTIEQVIEEERAKLTTSTPVTLERFLEWKRIKEERKVKDQEDQAAAREAAARAGRLAGISGRDLFAFKVDLFVDDDDGMDADETEREEVEVDVTPGSGNMLEDDTDYGAVEVDDGGQGTSTATATAAVAEPEDGDAEAATATATATATADEAVDASLFAAGDLEDLPSVDSDSESGSGS